MPKEYPVKLSIAIATYNHEKKLLRALDSIFDQKHNYLFEVIICDDGSSDETLNIIRKYHEKYPSIIRYTFRSESVGATKNFLCALRACRGEYIATLDADDYWTEPDKLNRQIEFLDKHSEFVLSSHRFKQFFEDTKLFSNDLIPNELFRGNPNGSEFGQEMYFKHWLTQKLTVVLRSSALDNTPQLETNTYNWDAQIFWIVLTKGKGYVHNFVGGVYSISSKEIPTRNNEISHSSIHYLMIEELLTDDPHNPHLKKTLEIYRNSLITSQHKNRNLLDIRKVEDEDFTIVCDDGWGAEVYNAFGIMECSPFMGIHIFNADFVDLIYDFKYYMSQSLRFISMKDSKYKNNISRMGTRTYPVALLGEKIELHFTEYNSAEDAEEKWVERVNRINWKNLFFKMDATRENNNLTEILNFSKLSYPNSNKACFLSVFEKKKIDALPVNDSIIMIDYWNPEAEIFFPLSLNSFDLIGWLNGASGIPVDKDLVNTNIFRNNDEKQDHYFIQFDKHTAAQLNALLYPEAYDIHFEEEQHTVIIRYNKSSMEHFYLKTQEKLHSRSFDCVNAFVNLSNKESRHVFILAKGNAQHSLRVDFVAGETNKYLRYVSLETEGLEQVIPDEFEWMHFDFSLIEEHHVEHLLSRIGGFSFYISPAETVQGTLQIMAIFIGSIRQFEKILK